ncbi:MAG: rubrerythrin family protein [Finegoldia magna]|uniref:rubrerythrin n=1 Tax=Finegoldia magna TaxID=1260 RepID=UPI000B91CB9D|nr:rubrerythrin family protein [Finegoldia magna]MDU2024405.1 rubrerythrin family protein [Finegoldia magna]MDU2130992.1 rubrerythrin family protein [Finegoldia magna]OXZ32924.1 rubrerythrin family protein [Finegoldia magna]
MASLKGTKTATNLMAAFAGESQANMRYTYFAKTAKKEGYVQISMIFEETARNEMAHAKRFMKFLSEDLQDAEIEIEAGFPVHLGDTKSNLKSAAEGEHFENSEMYPEFSKIAEEEGFKEIAHVFTEIGEVEEAHEKRYRKLLENIEKEKVFEREEVYLWKCNNCGYIHEGKTAPKKCPACDHPQGFFEIFKETY